MLSPEMIGMSIFGLLVLLALCAGIYQGKQQRRQVAEFSARHGWTVSSEPNKDVTGLLDRMDPASNWRPSNIMTVDRSPGPVYFFSYQVSAKYGKSSTSNGHACLAEYGGRRFDGSVQIFNRTPGVEKLVGGRQEVGGEEFRRAFTVTAEGGANARAAVNYDVERVLLDHAAGPGWYLTVTIGGGGILVSSFWAQSEQEWDYLIDLARRLKGALR